MTSVKFNTKPFEGTFNTFVDDLFTELPVFFKNEFNQTERKGSVPVNVKETDKSFLLEVIAPGFEKTDFKINVEQNLLAISADKKEDGKEDRFGSASQEKQIRREYSFRSFKRSFTLDEKTDATKIEASYIHGVLTLNLPKKEVVKASATEIVIK
ncbi:MAG: Hsp20/alpha crystallin family protein [Chitinophagaceae bacterium]|nr:Hsp20/alpha crystallin family protein [Chitinophagaceae bacterium]